MAKEKIPMEAESYCLEMVVVVVVVLDWCLTKKVKVALMTWMEEMTFHAERICKNENIQVTWIRC